MPTLEAVLVGVIIDPVEFILYTIGTMHIIRQWSLKDGTCQRSYPVETRED